MTAVIRRLCGLVFLLMLVLPSAPGQARAGPAMPDPRAMSGIPRSDPRLPAGTVTVRVLRGGFDRPAADHPVKLTLHGPGGGETQTREATTDAGKGRATFEGLDAFVGGTAVASVELDGQTLKSQPMQLLANAGTAVLLVGGRGGERASAPAHGQPGGPAVPPPGTAFPLPETPAGQLTIGTFDLAAKAPIGGVDVRLTITPPEGEPIVREGETDDRGKLVFDDLRPPAIPEGSKLVVEGTLKEGGERRRSEPFEMDPETGLAVVLAEGAEQWEAEQARAPAMPSQRPPLPGPRIVPGLAPGTIQVRVVDKDDAPVSGQRVVVVQRTAEGTGGTWHGATAADGVATIDDVEIRGDAVYFVEAAYDGAPYQSAFFGLDERGGVSVALRVFEVTSDRSVVRSALQVDIQGLENDLAQVVHVYEAMIEGDEAFWPADGMVIPAMEGAKGLVVLRRAEPWIEHEESADFVRLAGPLPPGELVNLSFGYLVEHDGDVEFEWEPPFALLESSVLLGDDQELDAPAAEKSDQPAQIPDRTVHLLGPRPQGTRVEFTIGGLPTTNPIFRRIGAVLAIAMAVAVGLGIWSSPRRSTRERLIRRRDDLLAHLERLGAQTDGTRREQVLAALDRVYRQLHALEKVSERPAAEGPSEQSSGR